MTTAIEEEINTTAEQESTGRKGIARLTRLMRQALLGRTRPTSRTPGLDVRFEAVVQWGVDVMAHFSLAYYNEYLDQRKKRTRDAGWRLWRYFRRLLLDSEERRLQGTGTEAERTFARLSHVVVEPSCGGDC
ncbi:hypothetical protein JCM10450v2_005331 [Rhodotorula kratochvilovae]